jgi:copper chaperone CopZ
MASMTLNAPTMFADHHVLKAREALFALDGVDDVYASSAWQAVIVTYDPAAVQPEAIEQALAQAGYGPDVATPVLAQSGAQFKDPSWEASGTRVTETNRTDLALSGDFRKY